MLVVPGGKVDGAVVGAVEATLAASSPPLPEQPARTMPTTRIKTKLFRRMGALPEHLPLTGPLLAVRRSSAV
jgi:hypothetical protein